MDVIAIPRSGKAESCTAELGDGKGSFDSGGICPD